jgi:hypothetical protein
MGIVDTQQTHVPGINRTSGIQLAQSDLAALLIGWEQVFTPAEFVVAVGLARRRLEAKWGELASTPWARRWTL